MLSDPRAGLAGQLASLSRDLLTTVGARSCVAVRANGRSHRLGLHDALSHPVLSAPLLAVAGTPSSTDSNMATTLDARPGVLVGLVGLDAVLAHEPGTWGERLLIGLDMHVEILTEPGCADRAGVERS